MEQLTAFDRAATVATTVLARLGDDRFDLPTPCTDWTVRAVLDHVVAGQLTAEAIIEGRAHPDRGADHLGRRPRATLERSVADLRAKLAAPGVLDRVLTTPMGERPGRVLADVRTAELFVHSWDVARATGQDTDLDAELAEYVRERWIALMGDRPRVELPFGEPQEVPVDAPAADRLAAYLGRSVVVA